MNANIRNTELQITHYENEIIGIKKGSKGL